MIALPPISREDLDEIVDAVGDWSDLRGARVLLTGATGFFGSWLVESFVHANQTLGLGAELICVSRDPVRFVDARPHLGGVSSLAWLRGDVRGFSLADGALTHVIHAATAASATLNDGGPLEMFDTIVGGTRHVLDLAVARGVSRFLLTSSGAVYGRQPPSLDHLDEAHEGSPDPLSPRSAYGEGKRAAELLAAIFNARHGVPSVVARGFAFVGPHLPLDAHFAIGNFIADGMAGRTIHVQGDGSPYRSYLYGSDMTAWLWAMLLRGAAGRAYNHGAEGAISIESLAKRVGERFSVPVTLAKERTPGVLAERYVPSTLRAREELGVRERVTLDEAIERTVRWHRGRAR